MKRSEYKVQPERLLESLRALAKIGANAQRGIDRQLGSPADSEARAWLQNSGPTWDCR